ncbi:NADP-dependent oxidoreductase domain-containing protein [Mycotypha africana]|uniref:NADP-dependent oxidoreductase domain-containing protein n=1 Tax=Mycotypha africana TaxID=64632 RepID=UPI0023014191|nr:NADP-dependent oxidoreductase domain-containing protein [Mycotypha africana]KAI8977122.1 NADP-dependent oxidoreductase domain-containing protein [Mycotypha africana]
MASIPKTIIPKTGRLVTRLGFGSYRISNATHAKALQAALEGGVNIIDTGSNFANGLCLKGASETIIGQTLQDLSASSKLSRESITLVTKSGYLSSSDVQAFDAQKDYIQLSDKMFHSISPRVLEKQLEMSLKRLKTSKIDIFMINSPERMLMAKNRSYTTAHLYKELAETFRYLDGLVAAGSMGGYGICSNTMAFPNAVDHISLNEIIKACPKSNQNLLAIQVPFNLYEREAIVKAEDDVGAKTVAQIAEANGIYIMTNRPLNAIANGQVRVLANHELGANGKGPAEHEIMAEMQKSFENIAKLESEIVSELPVEEESLTSKFVWGQVLSENLARLAQNHFATRHYLTQQVLPTLDKDMAEFSKYVRLQAADNPDSSNMLEEWMKVYKENMHALIKNIIDYAYIDTLRKNNDLDRIINALCPALQDQLPPSAYSPLSIKMLRLLLSHKNVGTVLTGMRDPLYVNDALFAAQQEPIQKEYVDDIWKCPVFW